MAIRGPINPYLVGPPVTGAHGFYGHHDLIESIVSTLTTTQQNAIVLYGPRRIGKSSLLHRLRRDETLQQDYLPIIFDMQFHEGFSLSRTLHYLAQTILIQLNLNIPIPSEAELAANPRQFQRAFLSEIYRHLGHKRILILLDEFDAAVPATLAGPASADTLLGYIRTLIAEEQLRLAFVFVAGQRLDLLGEGYLRLFRGAYPQRVGRLKQAEIYNLLTELGQQGHIKYVEETLTAIWALTNGHPYLTQLVGFEIYDRLEKQGKQQATIADVTACLDKAMEHGQTALDWIWNGFTPEQQWVLAAVADLTDQQQSVSDTEINNSLQQHVLIMTPLARDKVYQDLLEGDFLINTEPRRYRFAVEFIRCWIVKYHPLKEIQHQIEAISREALLYYQLGLTAFSKGDVFQAEKHYRQALEHNPHFVRARVDLAIALRAQNKIKEAIIEGEEAYKVDPAGARDHLINFRLIYINQLNEETDTQAIVDQLEQVLAIDPIHPEALQRLSEINYLKEVGVLLRDGRLDEALDNVLNYTHSQFKNLQWRPVFRILPKLDQLIRNYGIKQLYNELAPQIHIHLYQALQLDQITGSIKIYNDGKISSWWLETRHLFRDLNVPTAIPFLFLCRPELMEKETIEIHDLLSHELNTASQIAFLFIPTPGSALDRIRQMVDAKLRRPYAHNLVVLGPQDLERIVTAAQPRLELRHIFLSQVDLLSISPFKVTGPTSSEMFFGREQEQRTITEKAKTASYVLVGGRRMGKTSILRRLHRTRLPGAGFCSVYHDCSVTFTYDSLLSANIRDWQPASPSNNPTTFGALFQSPPTEKPLVLLLDEADKLVPADRDNNWRLFNTLRALANTGSAQIVFSGERTLREALRDPTSPLYNFANLILLGPLDFRSVEELVIQPMKQLELELVDEAEIVRRIYDFTSGHPNIVQRLCHRLLEQLNRQQSHQIKLKDVNAVIEDPGFQRDDFLSTYWEAATPLEKIVSLLMANDQSVCTLKAVRQALANRCDLHPTAGEVDNALQLLVDLRSILRRAPTGYEFVVEAFPRVVAGTMTLNDMLEILTEEYREQNK